MYATVILICAMNLPSAECVEGKRDVTIVMGQMVNTPQACLIEGTTKIASLAFAPRLDDQVKYYTRIKCVPRKGYQ